MGVSYMQKVKMNIKEAIQEGKILHIKFSDNYNCDVCGRVLSTSDYGIYCDNQKCKNYDEIYFAEKGDFNFNKI